MQLHRYSILIFLTLLCFCTQCRTREKTKAEFLHWLNNPENGLIQSHKVNGLEISVKYLPPEWLTYQDLGSSTSVSATEKDSLLKTYRSTPSFLLTIKPDKNSTNKGDIMFNGVADYADYKERVMTLNFGASEYLALRVDGKTYVPVLHTLENTYGMVEHRSLYTVFAPEVKPDELIHADTLELVFTDPVFHTGIHHFSFLRDDINQVPSIRYDKSY